MAIFLDENTDVICQDTACAQSIVKTVRPEPMSKAN